MDRIVIGIVLAWMLAAFFLVGTAINLVGPEGIRRDYARWGYPNGFRYVTAMLEFATVLLLLFPAGRPFGILIGAAIMAAAVGTTLWHREPKRAIAPAIVLMLAVTAGWLALAGG